ncbi:hypothetical protein PUN28_019858 [Cardiocondyla obscurior]
MEMVTRVSLNSLQKEDDVRIVSPNSFEEWTWSSLRKQFKYKNLEKLYTIYHRRIQYGYLSIFILLQLVLGFTYCLCLLIMLGVEKCFVDIVVYCIVGALLCPVLALSFRSRHIAKNTYLPVMLSWIIIVLLVICDLTIPVYYASREEEQTQSIRPAYATHSLLACYVFLPITKNSHALTLGLTASLCYLTTLSIITYGNMSNGDYVTKIVSDAIYFVCVNALGLYFRFMNEVVIRRSFLDRRKCVESTLRLNYEKDQEEQLTRSILPQHIVAKIKKDFRDIFKFIEEHKKSPPPKGRPYSDLCLETHDNVSILYADVVNFSGLTVTLPIRKLVETLNDLFGSFDEASERHNVLRIKFLGDCYYCVSGVPTPNFQHAKSCVDLGLDMIKIINEVRARVYRESGVDVNMRIGVHSGNIISGILGTNKWQYDVWSPDVVIANKMEQTGKPGKVHVTQQTLDLVNASDYNYAPVERLDDEVLRKYGIRSYLITPTLPETPLPSPTRENSLKAISPDTPILYSTPNRHYVRFNNGRANTIVSTGSRTKMMANNQPDVFASTYRRRTHFMDSCLRDYHLMLKAADAEMENAINQMPLSKWEQWSNWKHINPLFLTFRQWSWEIPFLREPDPVFKFYIGCSAFVLIFMGLMYLVPTFILYQWHLSTMVGYSSALMFLIALIPLTWMHFVWNRWKDPHDEHEGHVPHPKNKLLYFFYQTSVKVVWSALLRTILYLVITIMLATCAMLDMIFECKTSPLNNTMTNDTSEPGSSYECTPWQMTETCSLAILTSFLFLRVHYVLKFVISICVVAFYAWNVFENRSNVFESSDSWNPNMNPKLPHVLTVLFLTFSLHLIDRQAEYLSRLDYQWKRQLTKEQDEAFHTRNANKLLLRNILPEHVAEFYLNMNRTEENEPYHEAHNNVAVMFASLTELSIVESNILSDLNEIICEFDKLLFDPCFVCRIEKIKVAGTTYMAACGLEANRRDSMHSTESDENSSDNVVKVMAQFAVQMMSVLDRMNARSFTASKPHKLRIGISHGEVTAGVVGAQKPLYDIWGDAVNMASRMDTTGLPGKIQVTADTAAVLEQQGVKCHIRGETYVKPKGEVITYFVGVDEKGVLERVDAGEESTSL